MDESPRMRVGDLQANGVLLVEDGNHGEYRPRRDEFADDGVAFIRAADMRDGLVLFDTASKINEMALARIRKGIGKPRDVLLSHKGTVGKVAYVPDGSPAFVCSPQTTFYRSLDESRLDPGYLLYYLQSPEFVQQLRSRKGETDMADYVSLTEQRRLFIRVPSISLQKATSEVLGALDRKIEANRRLSDLVLQLAVAQYGQAVSGVSLGTTLAAAGRWFSGGTPSTSIAEYWGGSLPWISAASLKSFFIATSERTVTESGAHAGTRVVPAGAILFVVRGMSLKTEFRMGIAQRDVAFGQDCKALLVREGLPATAVAIGLLAKSEAVLALVDEAGHGTGRLPTDRLERVVIPLPPAERALQVEDALSSLVKRGAAAEDENRRLATLRDALLPPLLSGELRVRDAEGLVGEAM